MSSWKIKHGRYWMLYWCWDKWFSFGIHIDFKRRETGKDKIPYGPYLEIHWDKWFSFGIHIDFKRRETGKDKIPYGPYLEIHFLWFIFSLGYQPYYGTFNQ
jgi:hypothetical protein